MAYNVCVCTGGKAFHHGTLVHAAANRLLHHVACGSVLPHALMYQQGLLLERLVGLNGLHTEELTGLGIGCWLQLRILAAFQMHHCF